jgi:hypothetical protein
MRPNPWVVAGVVAFAGGWLLADHFGVCTTLTYLALFAVCLGVGYSVAWWAVRRIG